MTHDSVMEILTKIFRNIFDDDNLVLTDSTSASDIEDWDSLTQIDLVASIQEEFHIKLKISDINSTNNVGEIIKLILKKFGE